MPKDLIRYDLLVQDALCGVVKKVLADAAKHGLPGEHHFYITFRTHAPGVRLSARMREQYPDEMTIILQHQYENLKVTDHAIEVGLSFKGIPEVLLIPFEALTGFFDPSVQFSAKFEPHAEIDEEEEEGGAPASAPALSRPRQAKPPAPAPQPSISTLPASSGSTPARGAPTKEPVPGEVAASDGEAKVVSIDAFRKKT